VVAGNSNLGEDLGVDVCSKVVVSIPGRIVFKQTLHQRKI
jgi:hypothetical protein